MSVAWPLTISSNSRYLQDQNGVPFRLHGTTLWLLPMMASLSDLTQLIAALASAGITFLYFGGVSHDTNGCLPEGFNNTLPFLKDTSGNTYVRNGNTADVSTPNTTYWATVDSCLSVCQTYGIVCGMFPAYLGFGGIPGNGSGIAPDLQASGSTKVASYGNFLGNRYKNQTNLIWLAYGDCDPGAYTGLDALELTLVQNIQSAGATQMWGGHLFKDSGSPFADTTIAPYISLNTVYVFSGPGSSNGSWGFTDNDSSTYTFPFAACQRSPVAPAMFFDDPFYYLEVPPPVGYTGSSPCDLQDTRKRRWFGAMSGTVGGTVFADALVSDSGPPGGDGTFAGCNTSSGLLSPGRAQHKILGQVMASLPWTRMLPFGISPIGSVVTAGGGTNGQIDFVTGLADTAGKSVIAYLPPTHTGSVTINMTTMQGRTNAWWLDPTTGTRTLIASQLPNTGTQAFTTPGNNAGGDPDWVLLLDSPDSGPVTWWYT